MRTIASLTVTAALLAFMAAGVYAGEMPEVNSMLDKMEWLGHDCFKVEAGGKVIYTDPFKITVSGLPKADIILVTHDHYDHCSPAGWATYSRSRAPGYTSRATPTTYRR